MLRMPSFRYHHARSAAEAVELWHTLGGQEPGRVQYVAGGTDLLPNLKHRLHNPEHLIGITGLPSGIRELDGGLVIEGQARLHQVASSPLVQRIAPPLAQAAGLVAGPQLRRMGTLGGNVLLDTRCLYINQSASWRRALGGCLKCDGSWCHVTEAPRTCVAVQSSDCVPVLLGMDASLRLRSAEGERELPLRELYRYDGTDHLQIQPGELLTELRIPAPPAGFRGVYHKLRTRDSIDFPLLGVAVMGAFEGERCESLEIVLGAVSPLPKRIGKLEALTSGPLDAERRAAIAEHTRKQCRPNAALAGDVGWRRSMSAVIVQRALKELIDWPAP